MNVKKIALAAFFAAVAATTSSAAIVGVEGAGEELFFIPTELNNGAITDNESIKAYNEIQDLILTTDVRTDSGTIAAGTAVSSHMIFLNREAGTTGAITQTATFEFDGNVLGVLSGGRRMDLTDTLLGNGTDYTGLQGLLGRGLESRDSYSIVDNFFNVTLRVKNPGDWVRVVTVAAVPLPAGAVLLPGALLALGGLRRRKAKATA